MVDVVDPESRSRMMAGIRGGNTKPEMLVRRAIFSAGFRFRLHRRDLPGTPDIVLPRWRVAVFVHGCFWHQHTNCRFSKLPATRPEFWRTKLEGNVRRDDRSVAALCAAGWRVLVVWECLTRGASVEELAPLLAEWIKGDMPFGEMKPADRKT